MERGGNGILRDGRMLIYRAAMQRTLIGGVLALALFACGCSTFNRDWKKAAAAAPTSDLAGRWTGTWRSEANGHTDQLRCLMTPLTNDIVSARYQAKYRKGILRFTFSYTVPLSVTNRDGRFEFGGESNLGWYAGGVYRYRGSVTGTNFFSNYDSKYDRGTFEMQRAGASE